MKEKEQLFLFILALTSNRPHHLIERLLQHSPFVSTFKSYGTLIINLLDDGY